VFVVGDVHGHAERLADLLRQAGLIDGNHRWSGRDARLWLLGDLVDRGPDGIGAIELVQELERQGSVRCLLGNHEATLLSAYRFPDEDCGYPGYTFRINWEANGGRASDLERLTREHVAWIEACPAVARDGQWLIIHSDTDRYLEYGRSVESVCDEINSVLAGSDAARFARLLENLADRGAFTDPERLRLLLSTLGGERVVHGHTPIALIADRPPGAVREPVLYAGGRAMNADHGLYFGGSGFVVELR
jgi:hypothetical protein